MSGEGFHGYSLRLPSIFRSRRNKRQESQTSFGRRKKRSMRERRGPSSSATDSDPFFTSSSDAPSRSSLSDILRSRASSSEWTPIRDDADAAVDERSRRSSSISQNEEYERTQNRLDEVGISKQGISKHTLRSEHTETTKEKPYGLDIIQSWDDDEKDQDQVNETYADISKYVQSVQISRAEENERAQNKEGGIANQGISKLTLRTEDTESTRGMPYGLDLPLWDDDETDQDQINETVAPDNSNYVQSVQISHPISNKSADDEMVDMVARMIETPLHIRKKSNKKGKAPPPHMMRQTQSAKAPPPHMMRQTQSALLRGKELQQTRDRIKAAKSQEKRRRLPTTMKRPTHDDLLREKELQSSRERIQKSQPKKIMMMNGLPTVMMRQTQSTRFRDKDLEKARDRIQKAHPATTKRPTHDDLLREKELQSSRERIQKSQPKKVMKMNGLPTVMMRQTQSTRLRDKDLEKARDRIQKAKSLKRQAEEDGRPKLASHLQSMPGNKIEERRKKANPPLHNEGNAKRQNKMSYDRQNDFDGIRPIPRRMQNQNEGKTTHPTSTGRSSTIERKSAVSENMKSTKNRNESKSSKNRTRRPSPVHEVSDTSQSAKKGLLRRPVITEQLESCSWGELNDFLSELDSNPQEMLESLNGGSEAFHTTAWKAPPALTIKLFDMIGPNESDILLTIDKDGNTPLHLCCGNLAPPNEESDEVHKSADYSVLKTLLERAPESLVMQNAEGDTPLHLFLTSPLVSTFVDHRASGFQKEAIEAFRMIQKRMPSKDSFLIRDSSGASPFHTAIANEVSEEILFSLLKAAPMVCKVEDKAGMIPLHYVAAFLKTPAVVVQKMIEEYSYSVCHKTLDGDTPLHLLIRNSSDDNQSSRTLELNDNARLVLNLLLGTVSSTNDGDRDFNEQYCPLLIENREKLTPLHCFALFNAPKDIGNILMSHPLASKALTMANAHGSTPLHIAVASPNISIETIQVLGTMDSAMTQDRLHRTPLHVASQNFHASAYMIRSLIKINPLACNKQSSGGYLPIHLSVHSEAKVDVVRELYDSFPLGLERESVLADTPLHKAASNNAPKDVADFLIEHNRGAIYKENHMGDLPLHCATASGASTEMVQTLVMAWPQGVSTQNRAGDTPLHLLLKNNPTQEKLNLLIYSTASSPSCILLLNAAGETPLHVAKDHNASLDIINALETAADDWTKQVLDDGC